MRGFNARHVYTLCQTSCTGLSFWHAKVKSVISCQGWDQSICDIILEVAIGKGGPKLVSFSENWGLESVPSGKVENLA